MSTPTPEQITWVREFVEGTIECPGLLTYAEILQNSLLRATREAFEEWDEARPLYAAHDCEDHWNERCPIGERVHRAGWAICSLIPCFSDLPGFPESNPSQAAPEIAGSGSTPASPLGGGS